MKRYKLNIGQLLLALAILGLNSSCSFLRKETIVNGIVYDQANGKMIEGIQVVLQEEEIGLAPFSSVTYNTIAMTETDAAGRFYFKEDLKNRQSTYQVKALTEEGMYFDHAWYEDSLERVQDHFWVEPGMEQTIVLPLVSYGQFWISASNQSTIDSLVFDLIAIGDKYEYRAYYEALDQNETYMREILKGIPSGATKLAWKLSAEGFDTVIYDSIYVIPHQQGEIHFTFDG